MIVRKFASERAKSKHQYIADLLVDITMPRVGGMSDIQYIGTRGFITENLVSQCHEMIAVAVDASRSEQPVAHWMLSWKPGESPNADQIESTLDILLGELELSDHQAIYALHAEGSRRYLRLAVNRAHVVTGAVIKPNGGFDLEAAHRAVAKIIYRHGWEAETGARYVYRFAPKCSSHNPSS